MNAPNRLFHALRKIAAEQPQKPAWGSQQWHEEMQAQSRSAFVTQGRDFDFEDRSRRREPRRDDNEEYSGERADRQQDYSEGNK